MVTRLVRASDTALLKVIPYAYCQCGCGRRTKLRNGRPLRCLHNHRAYPKVDYELEDRGFETLCWIWQGAVSKGARGNYGRTTRNQYAHRVYYERYIGPVPAAKDLHHRCEVPLCVNPCHLKVMDRVEHYRLHGKFKLTPDDVRAIRASTEDNKALAQRYGIHPQHLQRVKRGRYWSHVTAPSEAPTNSALRESTDGSSFDGPVDTDVSEGTVRFSRRGRPEGAL